MPRYRNPSLERIYQTMLQLAADPASEMYREGRQHRGAGHRASFWDGFSGRFTFSGKGRSAHVIPGTPSAACFMAGREFARRQKRAGAETPSGTPSRDTAC